MIIVEYKVLRNGSESKGKIELSNDEFNGLDEQEQFEEIYTWIKFKEPTWDALELLEIKHNSDAGGLKSETLYSRP